MHGVLHINLREQCGWLVGSKAGRVENTRGAWLRSCPLGTMGCLGEESHGLEISSLKRLLSQLDDLGSTSRSVLPASSDVCMKLNPTLSGQSPACCQGKMLHRGLLWGGGVSRLTMIRWEKTQLLQEKKTPAASTCCQPRGKASTCCLKTQDLRGRVLIQRARPPLPSAFHRSLCLHRCLAGVRPHRVTRE